MIGVSLSRWTMSYFAAALAALLAAEALMAAGVGYPNASIAAAETLALVHLVAIGWLSLLMCGALFQFVPVLIARPLFSDKLPLITLLLLLAGLAALLLGFMELGGEIATGPPYLPAAGVLLGAGFTLVLWNLGRTLRQAHPLPLPARFVAVGLAAIGATAALGIIFALALGGVSSNPQILELTAKGVPIHVIAGVGGWLTFTAMGVSYRLMAMFMLAPDLDRRGSRASLHLGTCALAIAVGGGVAAICLEGNLDSVLFAAGAVGVAAVALYGRDMLHLYRARKRRHVELNARMAALALASLALGAVLLLGAVALGELPRFAGGIVFLLAFGWLSGLALAKLYKIVPFLTWLECYGPVLGKGRTPRVQDLVIEKRAMPWFLLYFAAVWLGTGALLAGYPLGFRLSAALMLVASAGIVAQLVRARRLADVGEAARFPAGTRPPRLLLSLPHHS